MRLVFLGSPPFAIPILERLALSERHQVLALVTPPDRPRGRGRAVVRSELAALADEHEIPVVQPQSTKDPAFVETLAGFGADVLMVASYGEILRRNVLELCEHGALNVHGSLLPRWRGASPIQRSIAAGDQETGVSIQRMVLALDAGDVMLEKRTPIGAEETAADLFERLSVLGADAAEEALDQLEEGRARFTPQDESLVTLAPKLTKEDGRIQLGLGAAAIARHVRAMTTWPGARVAIPGGKDGGKDLVVLEARPVEERAGDEAPGTLLSDEALVVRCGGQEAVRFTRVKPAGKQAMTDDAFCRGARLSAGDRLGG